VSVAARATEQRITQAVSGASVAGRAQDVALATEHRSRTLPRRSIAPSMAVKIRLRRMGMKKAPYYRVVVADSRSPRDGRFIENIGIYHPTREPSTVEIDVDKARYWLAQGAQPSEAVVNLLAIVGITKPAEQRKAVKARRAERLATKS
jgi:small subunit ribosomal protein S16